MKAAGFNLVRINLVWPAAYPGPAYRNESYLDKVRDLYSLLVRNEIHAMITVYFKGLTDLACGFGSPRYAIPDYIALNISEFPQPLDLLI